ncbi:hypothetical protein Lalb_Chr08g0232271 [Lupinus albus]|uniref:Knottin, scorpion toxin n=1 Tax=Lupinus albus TaxID=3870 RepID=A0A6A4Q3X8_LUPAL|nr:hypothetical protein Lalb_Chr08g0232271 [Lupinus albus]
MACHNCKTCLLLIFSIFLLFGAGVSNRIFSGPGNGCIGICTGVQDCRQDCVRINYPLGGKCVVVAGDFRPWCCCSRKG